MDVSDGLVGDLDKLCRASGVSAEIDVARVPLSTAARAALASEPALIETVLTGGDDYEVLLTMPARRGGGLAGGGVAQAGVAVAEIGTIVAGQGAPRFLGRTASRSCSRGRRSVISERLAGSEAPAL